MNTDLTESELEGLYHMMLNYGPEPMNHESRARFQSPGNIRKFVGAMYDADVFTKGAYYTAGELGVDSCLVDWMADVAEDTETPEEFIEAIVDGYGSGTTEYYVYRTNEGQEVGGPYDERRTARREAGRRQAQKGDLYHVVERHEETP